MKKLHFYKTVTKRRKETEELIKVPLLPRLSVDEKPKDPKINHVCRKS